MTARACDACLRRTWLIARLAGHLELARHGGPARSGRLREVLALDDERLVEALGGPAREQVAAERDAVDVGLLRARVAAAGLTSICRHDEAYPERLRELPDAPAVLHIAGRPGRLRELAGGGLDDGPRAVAVVGTRRASPDGLELARALGRGLAAAGVTVVSGLALGVDSAAHAGALQAGGPTVAVLAGGADRASPASRRDLYREVVRTGCAIAEVPPRFSPFKWCFPARNRIIAGLATMTVVVEAAARSGSLITAEFAADLGRDVGAVPGSPLSWRSEGANALLRDGATVVREARDVLDAVLGVGAGTDGGARGGATADPLARFAGLEPRLRVLLEAVASGRDTVASLAATPAEVGDVLAGLTELELLGVLRRATGGRYVLGA